MDRRSALRRLAVVGAAVPAAQWLGALPAAATGSVPPGGGSDPDPSDRDLLRWTLHLLLFLFGRYVWVRCAPTPSGGWTWEIEWDSRTSPRTAQARTAAASSSEPSPGEPDPGWVVEGDDGTLIVVLPPDGDFVHGFAVAEADRRDGVDNGDGSVVFDVR